MAVNLKRLLKKARPAIAPLIDVLDDRIQIRDTANAVWMGSPTAEGESTVPILVDETPIGWVSGPPVTAAAIATLLTHLAQRDQETRSIAHEALENYREINLLYNLSEKLSVSLDPAVIAHTVLVEARKLIPATDALIRLLHPTTAAFEVTFGLEHCAAAADLIRCQQTIAETVVRTGKGELVNQWVAASDCPSPWPIHALICVPLKASTGIIGVALVCQQQPVDYTAQHFKLLTAVASQAAPAIANAQLHQQQIQEAQEREHRLQQQLRELRLEVDATKRAKQVAEITETDYFQQLQQRAGQLRQQRKEKG